MPDFINWFTISNKAMNFIINEISTRKLLEYFKDSFCIDEVILMNSRFKDKIYSIDKEVTDNKMSLRYVNWTDGPEYPKLLKKEDLVKSFDSDIFFVRKVSSKLDEKEFNFFKGRNYHFLV